MMTTGANPQMPPYGSGITVSDADRHRLEIYLTCAP